jgi:hypothetical protein
VKDHAAAVPFDDPSHQRQADANAVLRPRMELSTWTNMSNTRSSISGAMPMPVSATETRAPSGPEVTEIKTRPPASVYFTAFVRRFPKTCASLTLAFQTERAATRLAGIGYVLDQALDLLQLSFDVQRLCRSGRHARQLDHLQCVGHGSDRVPEFVRQHRKELALAHDGLVQVLLPLASLRDVVRERQHALDLAGPIAQRNAAGNVTAAMGLVLVRESFSGECPAQPGLVFGNLRRIEHLED